MCGIAGFTHFGRPAAAGVLARAIEGLRHRGPNQRGVYEAADVSMGAVRLKIIDLAGGDQPIQTEDGEYVIVFNGEIYNHAGLRRELEQLGHRFYSHCDTEVALRAFVEWDVDCFRRFRGMFAVAFWQRSKQRLVLGRDRLGIKPLYYAIRDGNIHFGSELKSILEHPEIPRHISETGLDYYLSLNYVPTPYTLVDGIEKLRPGMWMDFRHGQARGDRYWCNRFDPKPIAIEEACAQLEALLKSSIGEHLISDVPLGIWASGGLDSSTILHYASQVSTQQLKTFSISFAGRRFDESEYFRLLAERYNTDHQEFDLSHDLDLTSAIHDISYYSDEPSADAGALPVWFLSRMTAGYVTVALSGEGGDEVFGGYQTYIADKYAATARRLPNSMLSTLAQAAEHLPVSDEKVGFDYKLKRFLAGTLLSPDEAHFYWNGTFSQQAKAQLGLPMPPLSAAELCRKLTNIPPMRDVVNRYLFADQHYYLPDDILYKCDRMSMAHSLEVRPPFLDHRIVEFAAGLPSDLKIRGSTTKYILRALVKDKLPSAILQRRKEGLDIPAQGWLRGPLRPLVEDALSPESVRNAGLFQPTIIESLKQRHYSRKENLGYHLWGLITLHLWMRRWNIQPATAVESNHVLSSAHV